MSAQALAPPTPVLGQLPPPDIKIVLAEAFEAARASSRTSIGNSVLLIFEYTSKIPSTPSTRAGVARIGKRVMRNCVSGLAGQPSI